MSFADVVAPEQLNDVVRRISEKLAGVEQSTYEVEIIAKDGRRVILETRSWLIYQDDKPVGVQGIARDITERRQAEEELRFQKSLLESQSEASPDGILVVANVGKIISHNSRLVEMWDIPKDVMASRPEKIVWQAVEHNVVNWKAVLAVLKNFYQRPDETHPGEIELEDGRTFVLHIAPVKGAAGTHYAQIWYFRDITERKRLEEQLRLSQRLEAIGSLAGGIAHDFNNVLTAITGYSDLILRSLHNEDPLRARVSEIKKAAERAAALTRQLLAFSRKQSCSLKC
jgi:PAS domain-containing protein